MNNTLEAVMTRERQQEETARLHAEVDYVHRYWLREFGAYPRPEDSMAIIGVIAALDEMRTLAGGSPAVPPAVPRPRKRGGRA
jgi:hypothetical protein